MLYQITTLAERSPLSFEFALRHNRKYLFTGRPQGTCGSMGVVVNIYQLSTVEICHVVQVKANEKKNLKLYSSVDRQPV